MKTVNMHEAKTHLSRLVQAALAGEPFIIARAGKPLVKVVPLEEEVKPLRRVGFMVGETTLTSEDVDAYFHPALDKEIEDLFYAEDPLLTQTLEEAAEARKQAAENSKSAPVKDGEHTA